MLTWFQSQHLEPSSVTNGLGTIITGKTTTGTVAARWWVAQRDFSRLEMDGPVGGVVRFLSAARF